MGLLDLFFPVQCINCEKEWSYICKDCAKKIVPHPDVCPYCHNLQRNFRVCDNCFEENDNLEWIIIAFRYNWLIKKAIKNLKYKWNYEIVNTLSKKLSLLLYTHPFLVDNLDKICLTYVPTHWVNRHFVRWYNQSFLLAKNLSFYTNLPLIDMFEKVKFTKKQTKLKRQERLKNLNNSFELSENMNIPENIKYIIIVDDITTTWTTIKKLANLLSDKLPDYKVRGLTIWRHS